jgi:2-polyprenyl-6-hydroxyphenyl methylase/3-demethylubiquinone-9 3-methyltransferase
MHLKKMSKTQTNSSIDQEEIDKFSRMSEEWWDTEGKLRTLHDINAIRISYIRKQILEQFPNVNNSISILKGLDVLDIGCGGGILSEPLHRLGAKVTAVDASDKNISIAKEHAKIQNLNINYICTTAEDLAKKNLQFDIVLCLEIIEHVANPSHFIESCSKMLKPGGLFFISTINRTAKSYLQAIIGAEYILRWIPVGTHSWNKFLKPSEIDADLRKNNIKIIDIKGLKYNPLKPEKWYLDKEIDVNYIMIAGKL